MAKNIRFNVMLTESQFELLKAYADQEEISMADAVRSLIKTLKLKQREADN